MSSLATFDPVVVEKKSKMLKVYRRTDRRTHTDGQMDGQQMNRKAHLNLELKYIKNYQLKNYATRAKK